MKTAGQNGIINISDVQYQLEMIRKETILKRHKYKIFEGSDGKWRTYVPDSTKDTGRRMLKKNSEQDLQDAIVKFYRETDAAYQPTLRKLYPIWLKYYSLRVGAIGSVKRVIAEWNKHYANSAIVDIPLNKLDQITVETWLLELIRYNNQTKKQYYNSSLIMRQMLTYCVNKEILNKNPMNMIEINSKLFRKEKKPESCTQVFTEAEENAIIRLAWSEWYEDNNLGACLAVILLFYTGVRIGEVVAFRKSDLLNDYIVVNRMERETYRYENETTLVQTGHEVIDHAKTSAGCRDVFLTKKGKRLIQTAIDHSPYATQDDFWLFCNYGRRCNVDAVTYRLRKYCDILDIPFRSAHKIRKTYVSCLIDGGINIDAIREQVGHEDERTTYHCYCFNRKTKDETGKQIENALNTIHY